YYGNFAKRPPVALSIAVIPAAAPAIAPVATGSTLGKLLLFFLKAGSLTFGSGLVIVPFLEQGLVQQYGWLSEREFLVAVAIGKIAVGDWLTALIAVVSLAVLFRWKVSNPLLIAVTAVVGLVAYPILQPAWVMTGFK